MHLLEVAEFLHGQGLAHRSLSPETLAWCVPSPHEGPVPTFRILLHATLTTNAMP